MKSSGFWRVERGSNVDLQGDRVEGGSSWVRDGGGIHSAVSRKQLCPYFQQHSVHCC